MTWEILLYRGIVSNVMNNYKNKWNLSSNIDDSFGSNIIICRKAINILASYMKNQAIVEKSCLLLPTEGDFPSVWF